MNLQGVLHKKVAGIPVMYLLGAVVAAFAYFAWKLKASPAQDDTATDDTAGTDGTDLSGVTNGDLSGSVYDSLKTAGTVVVAPSTDTTDTTPAVKTNETWLADGIGWLTANDKATGTQANTALSKAINGQDRSFAEQSLVDLWIKQGGPPPDGLDPGGVIGAKPSQKQGNPPLVHKVTGSSDNSYGKIAKLYYGHDDQPTYDLIQAANKSVGLVGPFAVGTSINVPAYHVPKTYHLPKDMNRSQIAAANGTTTYAIEALNNTSKTNWKKGETVRVA